MTTPYLLRDLKRDEGLRLLAYPDPESLLAQACEHLGLDPSDYTSLPDWRRYSGEPWTIGYGHTGPNVHPDLVWTEPQACDQLAADAASTQRALDGSLSWWRTQTDARQDVLVNMGFNMGVARLMGFRHMLEALRLGDWKEAAAQMADSVWAHQVGDRAKRLEAVVLSGVAG